MENNLCSLLKNSYEKFSQKSMYGYKKEDSYETISFTDFYQKVLRVASGFKEIGLKKGDKIFIFSDNRIEWILIDFALQFIGAISIPRGTDTVLEDVEYIINHSDSEYIIIENHKCEEKLKGLKAGIKKIAIENNIKNADFYFENIFKTGEEKLGSNEGFIEKRLSEINPEDVVTIIYTSGTTGNPKGVMLTQKSIMHNVLYASERLLIEKADTFISMLPIWHIFQRTCEYITIYRGSTTYYSNLKNFTKDVKIIKPTMLALVPRILEVFYEKINYNINHGSLLTKIFFRIFYFCAKRYFFSKSYIFNTSTTFKKRNIFKFILSFLEMILVFLPAKIAKLIFKPIHEIVGGRNRIMVSGGGSLPAHIDEFFNIIGFVLLDGYGLTETSPIIAVRSPLKVVLNTVGSPLDHVEVQIIDENNEEVSAGERGELIVKGDLVMKEYYKNPETTAKVLKNGWFYTGDLATKTFNGSIKILGRIKDTIVLSGGENIEPEKIEAALNRSEFISNSIVVGQNQKRIAAIITLEQEKITEFANSIQITFSDFNELSSNPKVYDLIKKEIGKNVNNESFKDYEKIYNFKIIPNQFEIGDELTQTLKPKRFIIHEKYKKEIASLFKK
jgi:long-chain acyl-CoA synthetase